MSTLFARGAAALLLGQAAAASEQQERGGSSITAVQKVVAMLEDMAARAKRDKQAEEVSYAEFSTWCANHQAALKGQISRGSMEIERLSSEAGKLSSDAKTLGSEVAQLEADVAQYEKDAASSKAQREKDHKAFVAEQQDYAESVDALERAIATLQKQNYDRTALLQVAGSQKLPSQAQQMMAAFVDMMGDDDGAGDANFLGRSNPDAHAYEFQSASIIDLLKKLKDEFVQKKAECEKEEMNSKHAFSMVLQDLTSANERASDAREAKARLRAEKAQKAGLLKKQLGAVTATKEADSGALSDATAECAEKKESFQEKQQLRGEELQALEKAIEILGSEDVQAHGAKYLGLAQGSAGTSLIQDLSDHRGAAAAEAEGIRRRVSEFLAQRGRLLKSEALGLLAQKMAADPFAKVKKLIEDLVARLLEEAKSDADHEGFCDREVGQSKLTREKLTVDVDGLTAEIEGTKATITRLTEQIADLQQALAELDAATREAGEQRAAEKAQNEATVKDATDAQKAVSAAVSVLQEFYAKAGKATALLQVARGPVQMGSEEWNSLANPKLEGTVDRGHKAGMQTFGATYSGQQEEAGGVLAMLEVIASDFATLKADTEAGEASAQRSHKDFVRESEKDKAVKERQMQMSSSDKVDAESKLRSDTEDLKLTQDKLLAAERYYEKLRPQCDDQGMTFEERHAARQAEIQSLKEALRILEGEDIA